MQETKKNPFKNNIIRFIIFTLTTLSLFNAKFIITEIKNKLAHNYYNKGIKYSKEKKYELALNSFNNSIYYNPTNPEPSRKIAFIYRDQKKYDLAVINFENYLSLNPIKVNQEQINFFNVLKEQINMAHQLNFIKIINPPPQKLFDLIVEKGRLKPDTIIKMKESLAVLWQDEEAKKLLSVLICNNIPINIAANSTPSHTHVYIHNSIVKIELNIMEGEIQNFKNPNTSGIESIEILRILAHELCHVTSSVLAPNRKNSLEEELSASMISLNIINRVLLGRELNTKETELQSKFQLSTLLSDFHKDLPLYNGFNSFIEQYGIIPPHLGIYQDISKLSKEIKDEDFKHNLTN